MKTLEIESPEELAAAIEAVEGLRRKQIRHVGKYINRLRLPCEQTTREAALAKHWQHTNTRIAGVNGGYATLELLLCKNEDDRMCREVTPEEATCAATVIQWLGTNCGFCWLGEALKLAGYRISKDRP